MEVPTLVNDDNKAYMGANVDSEDDALRHKDFQQGGQDSPVTPDRDSNISGKILRKLLLRTILTRFFKAVALTKKKELLMSASLELQLKPKGSRQ